MVARFAFIIHPIDPKRDVARKYKLLGHMPISWIDFFSRYFPPTAISRITGVHSPVGREAEGWLLAAPYTPRRMLDLPVVEPGHLKPGAIVCDVALPPNVSPGVRQKRRDVLVLDGGLVRVPGTPRLGFNFGLPGGLVYACIVEIMILALEQCYEAFTLSRNIELAQVEAIDRWAAKHGFRPLGLAYQGHPISDKDLDAVRQYVGHRA